MPANTIARLVPDQRAAGAEPVTARATLRWPNHPRAIGAADKIADYAGMYQSSPEGDAASIIPALNTR